MLSIIIPTYREADNARPLVQRLRAALDGVVEYEIVFVDDNSPDDIVARVAELQREGAPARVLVRTTERGLSSAIYHGFRETRGEIIMCMDADLSHPPEAIPKMLDALRSEKTEMVMGSRYVPGGSTDNDWGWYRRLNSNLGRVLAFPLTKVRDSGAGFFMMRRPVFMRATNLNPIGYKAALELMVKSHVTEVVEVPIHFTDRRIGESKMDFKVQWQYLVHLKRLYDYRFGRWSQFLQFCLVGASGAVIDLFTYALLMKLGLVIGFARALAIWMALTWNFALNRTLTFSVSAPPPLLRQYWRYGLTCLIGALVNWCASVGLTHYSDWFHDHKLCAAVAGILAGTLFNFFLSVQWVFQPKHLP
jgi:dolichol-phosphate mannosyltransferase